MKEKGFIVKKAIIIGSGISGLGAAALLAKAGYEVTVLEKNEQLGGRAGMYEAKGYRFDAGPSWYLMPEVFSQFFELLGERVEDHLDLVRLQPSYRVWFEQRHKPVDIYSDLERDRPTLEALEAGSTDKLREYLKSAAKQYELATQHVLYKNADSLLDLVSRGTLAGARHLPLARSMQSYVSRSFKSDELQKLLQYTLVFLGSSPYNAPALYNIMSHVDVTQGVFYPQGGIHTVTTALASIAAKHGAELKTGAEVKRITTEGGRATGVELADGTTMPADIVISNADIQHTESALLSAAERDHSEKYWQNRTLAPSALLMYLGVKGKVPELAHHNLYFCQDWPANFRAIFDDPAWPDNPSIYICAPSKTDPSVAPKGSENLFVLVPLPAGRTDHSAAELKAYADRILALIEDKLGIKDLRERIEYQKLFGPADFASRYNSYRGTGLGLAHTLLQTSIGRPRNQSRKLPNLYYVGANTAPGIGMPTGLISSQLMYKRLTDDHSAGPLSSL